MAPEQPRSYLIVWPDRTSVDLSPGLSPLEEVGWRVGVLTRIMNTTPLPLLPKMPSHSLCGEVCLRALCPQPGGLHKWWDNLAP